MNTNQLFKDILADEVDIPFNRTEDNAANITVRDFTFKKGKDLLPDLAHDLTRHDETSYKVAPLLIVLPNLDHPLMAQVDNSEWVNTISYVLLDQVQYRLLLQFSHQGAEVRMVFCNRHIIITV
jgi:hypothetical protein